MPTTRWFGFAGPSLITARRRRFETILIEAKFVSPRREGCAGINPRLSLRLSHRATRDRSLFVCSDGTSSADLCAGSGRPRFRDLREPWEALGMTANPSRTKHIGRDDGDSCVWMSRCTKCIAWDLQPASLCPSAPVVMRSLLWAAAHRSIGRDDSDLG